MMLLQSSLLVFFSIVRYVLLCGYCVCTYSCCLWAQAIRPETSRYEETSRYDDVIRHLRAIVKGSRFIHIERFGLSPMGKELPLVVVGDIPNGSSEAVLQAVTTRSKTVVYIQGNIHAGEVEGKEAILQLLRSLKQGKYAEWRKNLIILFVPILNADGNDMISLYNRPFQYGPIAGMGQRANGQNLDINRDHIKVETPEVTAFLRTINAYNPTVLMDLHTTNGSRHGYHLTYAPPLNPNTDSSITTYMRSTMLPALTQTMASKAWRTHYYGNFAVDEGYAGQGWYTFSHEPRFNNSYVGLRNRFAVLSEAYSYIDFKQRIDVTHDFMISTLEYCHRHALKLRSIVEDADTRMNTSPPDSISIRHTLMKTSDSSRILVSAIREEINPYSGAVMHKMLEDSVRTVLMPEYQAFRGTASIDLPQEYVILSSARSFTSIRRLLDIHGIRYSIAQSSITTIADVFYIDTTSKQERVFQGHKIRAVEGRYKATRIDIPLGSIRIPVRQSLGRLLAYMLEPQSDDGCAVWNVFDADIESRATYPVVRIH
jgi:hypothetical protein